MNDALTLAHVRRSFGGTAALSDVSLCLTPATLTGVIGPNGAGKSTLVNVACGQVKPTTGTVSIRGRDVTTLASHRRFELGLARTFQSLRLYQGLTCFENLCAGSLSDSIGHREIQHRAYELLASLALADWAASTPDNLPFGKQKLLAIGRVLVSRPQIVLMDEPFAGLTDEEIDSLSRLLVEMAARGAAILIVEHNIDALSRIVPTMVVLDNGEVIASGSPADVLEQDRVRLAYFGGHQRESVAAAVRARPS